MGYKYKGGFSITTADPAIYDALDFVEFGSENVVRVTAPRNGIDL